MRYVPLEVGFVARQEKRELKKLGNLLAKMSDAVKVADSLSVQEVLVLERIMAECQEKIRRLKM